MFMWEDKHYFRWANSLSPFRGELVGFSCCDSSYYQARKESGVTVLEFVTKGAVTLKVGDATVIKGIIDNTPNKIYSIQELADKTGRSKDFVIKAFKRTYGVTPHTYINEKNTK